MVPKRRTSRNGVRARGWGRYLAAGSAYAPHVAEAPDRTLSSVAEAPAVAEPRRLLLVEDDPGDAFLVQELLSGTEDGFEVAWVSTVGEAATACDPETACALVDLNLPDATGLDALRSVLQSCPGMPVVVLTGVHDRNLGVAAVAAGAQDYLNKGEVTSGLLDRAVRYAVERSRAERSARALAEAAVRRQHDEQITRGLLPQLRVSDPSLALVTRYLPGTAGEVLGADFMDAVELPDATIRMIIGDVAGHGPGEAAIGVNLRIAWRALTLAGLPSATVFGRLQDMLIHDVDIELFVTAAELTLSADRRRLSLRSSGHPAPLLLGPAGVVELDGPHAPVLGVNIDDIPPEITVDLPDRWRLLGFTDGLIEGRTPQGPRWGSEGLLDYLRAQGDAAAVPRHELADGLLARAAELHGGPLPDDVALLLADHGG